MKQQALLACIECNIEISTVALATVYFERLALDCRVDKSNRRLTFAACLLIAIKINEANVALFHEQSNKTSKKGVDVIKSWIRTKKDDDVFASLLEFFTHEWSLSLKTLFAAEFGVFAALGFKLHATPSQVAFHFKRIMKSLEWSSRDYLGRIMYEQWKVCCDEEDIRKDEEEQRHEERQKRKEEKLQHDFQMLEDIQNSKYHQSIYNRVAHDDSRVFDQRGTIDNRAELGSNIPTKKRAGLGFFNRLGLKRSTNNLNSLISPQRLRRQVDDVILKNHVEPATMGKESLMKRSNSSPNFKRNSNVIL